MTIDPQILLAAGGIFALRLLNMTMATIRMLIMVQGKRLQATALGFFESLVFVIALGGVVSQLDNVWNILGYCSGFAVGTYLGMLLEDRLITNFLTVNIVSSDKAHEIAEAVRAAGFGATEGLGQGADGFVGSIRVVVRRREVQGVIDVVSEVDPEAFVTLDETRGVRHGYLRADRPMR